MTYYLHVDAADVAKRLQQASRCRLVCLLLGVTFDIIIDIILTSIAEKGGKLSLSQKEFAQFSEKEARKFVERGVKYYEKKLTLP